MGGEGELCEAAGIRSLPPRLQPLEEDQHARSGMPQVPATLGAFALTTPAGLGSGEGGHGGGGEGSNRERRSGRKRSGKGAAAREHKAGATKAAAVRNAAAPTAMGGSTGNAAAAQEAGRAAEGGAGGDAGHQHPTGLAAAPKNGQAGPVEGVLAASKHAVSASGNVPATAAVGAQESNSISCGACMAPPHAQHSSASTTSVVARSHSHASTLPVVDCVSAPSAAATDVDSASTASAAPAAAEHAPGLRGGEAAGPQHSRQLRRSSSDSGCILAPSTSLGRPEDSLLANGQAFPCDTLPHHHAALPKEHLGWRAGGGAGSRKRSPTPPPTLPRSRSPPPPHPAPAHAVARAGLGRAEGVTSNWAVAAGLRRPPPLQGVVSSASDGGPAVAVEGRDGRLWQGPASTGAVQQGRAVRAGGVL